MGRMKKARAKNRVINKYNPKNNAPKADEGDDMDDEIDKFHKNRDKLSLELTDSEDEEEFENPVFDLKGEESEDEEEEDMAEEELDDMAAKIEKQAKYLRQKTGITEDEDDEEEEEPEKEKAEWGKRKRDYYRADNIDYEIQSSDDEGPALEEAEARKIQQKIAESHRPEDFDQVSDEDMHDETDTLEKLVERSDQAVKAKVKDKTSDVPIEKVKKDFDSLSKDAKLQVVMSNAPELVGLLTELKEALHELEHKVQPLLKKFEDGKFATREGKSYVEMKHMLLLSYCQCIVFYLLLKAEGRSVCDHPVIAKLVEIRTLLEKVRPIDKKLQIDKLMVLDTSKLPQPEKSAKDEVKVSKATANGNHKSKHLQSNVQNAKPAEQPEEFVGEESRNMLREMERLQEKARREQLLEQARVSELSTGKRREAKRHRGLLDDLEDDLGGLDQESQPKTISRVVAEAGKRQKKPKIISGDTDLPVKEDIGERRRKHEVQAPGRTESLVEESEDDDDGQTQREDEFYQEAKAIKLAKDAARAAKYKKEPASKPEADMQERRRHITTEMEKNRGLTPYRKKASKNPRKKYKMKHGKAVTRRKGQVRDIRNEAGPYGGESTGIRTNLSRSVRFN